MLLFGYLKVSDETVLHFFSRETSICTVQQKFPIKRKDTGYLALTKGIPRQRFHCRTSEFMQFGGSIFHVHSLRWCFL